MSRSQFLHKAGWFVENDADGSCERHVIPSCDDKEHKPSPSCWCKPREEDNRIWSHYAYDKREDYEYGIRKLH